jgi:hypothetical protein
LEILDQRDALVPLQRKLLLDSLPEEELYDLSEDPHELNNLALHPDFAELKQELRRKLDVWIKDSGDLGFEPKDPEHVQFFEDYRINNKKRLEEKRTALRETVRKAVETAAAGKANR